MANEKVETETEAERGAARAIETVHKELQDAHRQLAKMKRELLATRTEEALEQAFEKTPHYQPARSLAKRLLMAELKDLAIDDDGLVTASHGELEGEPLDKIVAQFIDQNDYIRTLDDAPAATTPPKRETAAEPPPAPTGPDVQNMTTEEMAIAAGEMPPEGYTGWRPPKLSAKPIKNAAEMTIDELAEAAGDFE